MQGYTIQGDGLTKQQERMRRDLRYHFMNPKEKWKAKGTLPIKLILIIIKLVIVTTQIILFSDNNSNEVSFVEGSKTTFKHLFLHNWQASYETLPYPPTTGPFAIYKIQDFYLAINYALENYYKIEIEAIGPYSYADNNIPIMTLCLLHYRIGEISPSNFTYNFSPDIMKNCTQIEPIRINSTNQVYDVKKYLKAKNYTINFNKLVEAYIQFSLRSIQLKSYEMDHSPDCLQFDIQILFDNINHNGQMDLSLHMKMTSFDCIHPSSIIKSSSMVKDTILTLDIFALSFSIISALLCTRSLLRLYRFWKGVKQFFRTEINIDISDKWKHFCGIGYVAIFIGDILVLCGTIIKLEMHKTSKKDIDRLSLCNYFLGLGLFLGHLTLVRYFSYFPKSLILVKTIRIAIPALLRFSLCSSVLYLAFSILGWNILGPYHIKFRTLTSSIACLFSLMFGDDMFVTLSIINQANTVIYIFAQLFIYFFCVLFIFVVLNLILTIIYEAYEEAEKQESSNSPPDAFWDFVNSCPDSWDSSIYKYDLLRDNNMEEKKKRYLTNKCVDVLCCCIGKGNHTVEIKIDDESAVEETEIMSNFASSSRSSFLTNYINNLRKKRSYQHLDYGTLVKKVSKESTQSAPVNPELSRDRGFSF